jgi:chromosome segregation ATPase
LGVGGQAPQLSTGNLLYTALKFRFSGKFIMSLKMAEEVSAQVPADDFQALEEKVYRTIELYKAAREARSIAERDVTRLREQLEEREEQLETLRKETIQLRREREEVRSRVEKMLQQIEVLNEEQAAS